MIVIFSDDNDNKVAAAGVIIDKNEAGIAVVIDNNKINEMKLPSSSLTKTTTTTK